MEKDFKTDYCLLIETTIPCIKLHSEIIEVNDKLDDEPELVNDDPYGEGWMIKIKITDASQRDDLLSAESYQDLI